MTALWPGSAVVTIHDPASSAPWPMTRGTGVNATAQAMRAASPARSIPLAAGVHLTKHRSAPEPTSKVRPPSELSHTGRAARPAATAATGAGTRSRLMADRLTRPGRRAKGFRPVRASGPAGERSGQPCSSGLPSGSALPPVATEAASKNRYTPMAANTSTT
jgi:hypothetical protein